MGEERGFRLSLESSLIYGSRKEGNKLRRNLLEKNGAEAAFLECHRKIKVNVGGLGVNLSL